MTQNKRLLIIAHCPSPNTIALKDALLRGIEAGETESIEVVYKPPLEANADDVLAADAIILGTTENLGYMSGALKDFFDRIYYPCLEQKQGLPCVVCIRAGMDGTGSKRAIDSILTGLKWRQVQDTLIMRGEWNEEFIAHCEELGMVMAVGLDAGVF